MSESPDRAILLGRQPILGREQQLLAYELLFRGGAIATANRAEVLDGAQATAPAPSTTAHTSPGTARARRQWRAENKRGKRERVIGQPR